MQCSVVVINTSRTEAITFLISRISIPYDDDDDDENLYDWSDNLHNQSGLGDIHAVL